MGSLRNPVGPLPSTIYWRRRAVLLSVVGLLALLTVWVVGTGGGGGNNGAGGANGKNPATSITPGPSGSGPAISQHPGGRDESSGGGDSGGDTDGSGSDSGGGSGGGSGDGSGDGSTGSGTSTGGGSGDGAKNGGGSADQLPAGSTLPNCTTNNVKLTLKSVQNTYAPGEQPAIELIAKNTSGSDCKVDLGPKNTVLTITQAGSDNDIWASDDCPKDAAGVLYRVPAGSQVVYTVKWDRKPGAPACATPPSGSASAGTYLVEAKAPGLTKAQASFVLSKD
ncbi:hypothetical protein [Streptomyces rhizosphaerihabitans]|uniref:hypothetical protein n=1 Tax=Streptomyces rhizosphaerihabitans TaxID=1266770 RepID=UPI0021BE23B1|nr:hypothetical protein [Streptomyces rhizosphaerihabitans]MCT9006247.1 hypothetical protein [Streptomyces rhizosphaerihabitans]